MLQETETLSAQERQIGHARTEKEKDTAADQREHKAKVQETAGDLVTCPVQVEGRPACTWTGQIPGSSKMG